MQVTGELAGLPRFLLACTSIVVHRKEGKVGKKHGCELCRYALSYPVLQPLYIVVLVTFEFQCLNGLVRLKVRSGVPDLITRRLISCDIRSVI